MSTEKDYQELQGQLQTWFEGGLTVKGVKELIVHRYDPFPEVFPVEEIRHRIYQFQRQAYHDGETMGERCIAIQEEFVQGFKAEAPEESEVPHFTTVMDVRFTILSDEELEVWKVHAREAGRREAEARSKALIHN